MNIVGMMAAQTAARNAIMTANKRQREKQERFENENSKWGEKRDKNNSNQRQE